MVNLDGESGVLCDSCVNQQFCIRVYSESGCDPFSDVCLGDYYYPDCLGEGD